MKVKYQNDESALGGYGVLIFSELLVPEELSSIRLSIIRSSDHKFLGKGGWQESKVPLAPLRAEHDGETLRVYIGPDIVDFLDMQEVFRISLEQGGGNLGAATLSNILGIKYSPIKVGSAIGRQVPSPPKAKPVPPIPPVNDAPAPEPEPKPEPAPEPELKPEPAPEPEPPLPPVSSSGKGLKVALVALALAVIAGGAGFFFYSNGMESKPVALSPLQEARALFKSPGTPDPVAMVRLAERLKTKPDSAEAVYMLYEAAAEQGNAHAMLCVGDFLNPGIAMDCGSIQTDPELAMAYYEKAAGAGKSEESAERLAVMKQWAEGEARKGSAPAKLLLERLP